MIRKVSVGSRVINTKCGYCAEYYCYGCKTVITSNRTTGCDKCKKLFDWNNIIPESR